MKNKVVPKRKCVACLDITGKRELLRIVKSKEGEIFLDKTGKQNGRGAYLCKDEKCLELAIKGKKLERSFKCKVPNEIYEEIKKYISTGAF